VSTFALTMTIFFAMRAGVQVYKALHEDKKAANYVAAALNIAVCAWAGNLLSGALQ